jgi:thioredoxin 1
MAVEITDANFEATVKNGVTLVDFWAPWCGPCRMQGPVVDALAVSYQGKATIAKMNVDENPETPAKFAIMSIPTLIIFKDGEKVQLFVGVQSAERLKAALDAALGQAAGSGAG